MRILFGCSHVAAAAFGEATISISISVIMSAIPCRTASRCERSCLEVSSLSIHTHVCACNCSMARAVKAASALLALLPLCSWLRACHHLVGPLQVLVDHRVLCDKVCQHQMGERTRHIAFVSGPRPPRIFSCKMHAVAFSCQSGSSNSCYSALRCASSRCSSIPVGVPHGCKTRPLCSTKCRLLYAHAMLGTLAYLLVERSTNTRREW